MLGQLLPEPLSGGYRFAEHLTLSGERGFIEGTCDESLLLRQRQHLIELLLDRAESVPQPVGLPVDKQERGHGRRETDEHDHGDEGADRHGQDHELIFRMAAMALAV